MAIEPAIAYSCWSSEVLPDETVAVFVTTLLRLGSTQPAFWIVTVYWPGVSSPKKTQPLASVVPEPVPAPLSVTGTPADGAPASSVSSTPRLPLVDDSEPFGGASRL